MSSLKYPPAIYDPYSEWKNELIAWQHLTDLDEDKHGAALLRCLEGDAKKAAQKVPIASVIKKEGWKLIIAELDKLYEEDVTASKYTAFDQLVKFRRSENMGLDEYLRKFELLRNQCESSGTVIGDDILAYFMLECANLSEEKNELVRATVDMDYAEMRKKLRRIFPKTEPAAQAGTSSKSTNAGLSVVCPIKQEESVYHVAPSNQNDFEDYSSNNVMYGGYNNYHNYARGRGQRGKRGQSKRYNRGNRGQNFNKRFPQKRNPTDSEGNVMLCENCGSWNHFKSHCPDLKSNGNASRFQDGNKYM